MYESYKNTQTRSFCIIITSVRYINKINSTLCLSNFCGLVFIRELAVISIENIGVCPTFEC